MKWISTPFSDAWVLQLSPNEDERGFFGRMYCETLFSEKNLETHWPQISLSFNKTRGILRGLHYQCPPHEECKLIRCIRGAIYDVIVDIRPSSPTYLTWFSVILDDQNRDALYVPKGFAHGFQTLTDQTEVLYQISYPHVPEAARGIRWNDPLLAIEWPIDPPIMNERDHHYSDMIPSSEK